MPHNYEGRNSPDFKEGVYQGIIERKLRAKVLREWSTRLRQAADLIETEADTALDPQARSGRHGYLPDGQPIKRGVGLLSPNVTVPLDSGKVLGLQISLSDLEAFSSDAKSLIKLLNQSLHTWEQGSTPSDGTPARARLEGDRVVIEDAAEDDT